MIELEKARAIVKKQEIAIGLEKYKFFREQLFLTDVSKDKAYQKEFRKFYQMLRFYNDDFAQGFFYVLEQRKYDKDLSFQSVLNQLKEIQNTYEMSFSSKLLHTIQPKYPIWDSVVTQNHFRIRAPYSKCKNKEQTCIDRYNDYIKEFYSYMYSTEGKAIISIFDQQYPESDIDNVKKVDFILWQDR